MVLLRTNVSEVCIISIIRVAGIGELGTTLAVIIVFLCSMPWLIVMANVPSSPILLTLMMEALSSPETSVLTRAT
jgi:hypothetical protein